MKHLRISNNGYATAPHCYVIRTMPILLDQSDQMCLGEKA